jgi:hypothetical protein
MQIPLFGKAAAVTRGESPTPTISHAFVNRPHFKMFTRTHTAKLKKNSQQLALSRRGTVNGSPLCHSATLPLCHFPHWGSRPAGAELVVTVQRISILVEMESWGVSVQVHIQSSFVCGTQKSAFQSAIPVLYIYPISIGTAGSVRCSSEDGQDERVFG